MSPCYLPSTCQCSMPDRRNSPPKGVIFALLMFSLCGGYLIMWLSSYTDTVCPVRATGRNHDKTCSTNCKHQQATCCTTKEVHFQPCSAQGSCLVMSCHLRRMTCCKQIKGGDKGHRRRLSASYVLPAQAESPTNVHIIYHRMLQAHPQASWYDSGV